MVLEGLGKSLRGAIDRITGATSVNEQLIKDVYEVEARVGLDADGEIYVLPKRYIEEDI